MVDVVIGEEGPETKYAIICEQCFAHNGLVVAEELEDIRKLLFRASKSEVDETSSASCFILFSFSFSCRIDVFISITVGLSLTDVNFFQEYVCPKCNHFNPSRRNRREGVKGTSGGVDGDVIKSTVLKNGNLKSIQPQRLSASSKPKEKDDGAVSDPGVTRKPIFLRTSSRSSTAPQSPIVTSTPRHSSRLRNPISPDSSPSPLPSPTPFSHPTKDTRALSESDAEEEPLESENEADVVQEVETPNSSEEREEVKGEEVEEEEGARESDVTVPEEEEQKTSSVKKSVGTRKKKKGRRG